MNTSGRRPLLRAVVGVVLPLSLLVVTMLPLVLFRERLPEPLAVHWGSGGRPNGTMTFAVFVVFNLLFAGVPASFMAVVSRRDPAYRGEIAPAAATASFAAAMVAVLSWIVVGANLDVADWTGAGPVGFGMIGLALVVAMAGLTAALARSIETAREPEPVVPRAMLRPGARAEWTGAARSVWALPFVVVFGVSGVVMALTLPAVPVLGLIFILIGITGLAFTSIQVRVDRDGVRVTYGALGWPTQRVPLVDIRQASAITVRPMQRGGWGYRGSLRLMGRAAVVLRAGEGLRLDLAGDRVFVVTLDGAQEAAALLNALVATPAPPDSLGKTSLETP